MRYVKEIKEGFEEKQVYRFIAGLIDSLFTFLGLYTFYCAGLIIAGLFHGSVIDLFTGKMLVPLAIIWIGHKLICNSIGTDIVSIIAEMSEEEVKYEDA